MYGKLLSLKCKIYDFSDCKGKKDLKNYSLSKNFFLHFKSYKLKILNSKSEENKFKFREIPKKNIKWWLESNI